MSLTKIELIHAEFYLEIYKRHPPTFMAFNPYFG